MKIIEIYTDGSAHIVGKPSRCFGAYAFAHIENDEVSYEESGAMEPLKTGGAEIMAVINALRYADMLYEGVNIRIFCDSMYVIKQFNEVLQWWAGSGGWKLSSGDPVKNKELWKALVPFRMGYTKNKVSLIHVKGHDGNKWNDYVDDLAKVTMRKFRDSKLKPNG